MNAVPLGAGIRPELVPRDGVTLERCANNGLSGGIEMGGRPRVGARFLRGGLCRLCVGWTCGKEKWRMVANPWLTQTWQNWRRGTGSSKLVLWGEQKANGLADMHR